ncbi:MAG: DNA polymerase III subunit [Acidobacteria bacterium]|nr:DNA polymerase III subunit [Acidobacteriota bacterium]
MSFRALIGHRQTVDRLMRAIARGSLPPTLLFTGAPGIGKWHTAVATAQAVNCLDDDARAAGDACGTCRSCDRVARGMHVDVLPIAPDDKASIKIDVIRDVLARTSYRPFEGRRRVVLIRDAETLELSAQNALLKSLEEPPDATMFVLVTSVPGALLPTVRSRTMRVRFAPLTVDEVTQVLERDHGHDAGPARAAAALADGSVGQALGLADADVVALRDAALRLLSEVAVRTDAPARVQAGDALLTMAGGGKKERSRDELGVVLRCAAALLRDLEAINAGVDRRVLAHPSLEPTLAALASRFGGDRARSAFASVDRALYALERNAGSKVVTEWLALNL